MMSPRALRNGAGRVSAVEIDPLILNLGKTLHFEKPYDSPRVNAVLDDARSYVETTNDRLRSWWFSRSWIPTPPALTTPTSASITTSTRSKRCKPPNDCSSPTASWSSSFRSSTPWIAGRLNSLLQTVFGRAPLEVQADASVVHHLRPVFYCRLPGAHRSSHGRRVPRRIREIASGFPGGQGLAHHRRLAVLLSA